MADKPIEIPKPLTTIECIDIMTHEATNALTRNRLLEKMHFILSLEGNKNIHERMMGQYQAQIKASLDSIRVLGSIKMEEENKIKTGKEPIAVEKSVDKKGKGAKV